jgi:hypothetical protein
MEFLNALRVAMGVNASRFQMRAELPRFRYSFLWLRRVQLECQWISSEVIQQIAEA